MKSALIFFVLVGVSQFANAGAISYGSRIAFEDRLTDQLDRTNVGSYYERLSKTGPSSGTGFWDECDAANIYLVNAPCALNADAYESIYGGTSGGGWNLFGLNLNSNIRDIGDESFFASTESEGRGTRSSSMAGEFRVGFSDEMITDIKNDDNQGIRFGYGFSWIGRGVVDEFEGVIGQWGSQLSTLGREIPSELAIYSSFRTRITARTGYYDGQPIDEDPKVIFDQTFNGDGESGMTFPPDPAAYGFIEGDYTAFSFQVEQRLWTERKPAKVSEPNSLAILGFSLFALFALRKTAFRSKAVGGM
jgi:hypothetical protein